MSNMSPTPASIEEEKKYVLGMVKLILNSDLKKFDISMEINRPEAALFVTAGQSMERFAQEAALSITITRTPRV